jgi:hypothetical protein
VIDIIFGDVLVVLARFRATAVVTLRWSKLSVMFWLSLQKFGKASAAILVSID